MKHPLEHEERVWLSIPLSRETAERLARLADACHADRPTVAASLLHDLLEDDAEAHLLEMAPAAGNA